MSPVTPWQPDWKALDGNRFQELCLDLLFSEGYELQDQGIGPDGGVDAILLQKLDLPDDSSKHIRWATQFKFKVDPKATVKPHELGNIENLLGRFEAEGFFLVTNGRITNKAQLEIRTCRRPGYVSSVWTRRHLERRLVERREIACRYFPLPPLQQPTSKVELTIDLPFDEFSDRQKRLLRHALASFLEIPVVAVKIRKITEGSTKVLIEVPQEKAQKLREILGQNQLTLNGFGFEPAILSIREVPHEAGSGEITPGGTSKPPRPAPPPLEKRADYRKTVDEVPPLSGRAKLDIARDERFYKLFSRYHRSILGYFVQSGVSRDRARELAQEVFLRVYRDMNQYRGEAEWTFLQKTALTLRLNELRARKTSKRSGEDVSLEQLPNLLDVLERDPWTGQAPESPEADLGAREEAELRRKRLRDAIAELPEAIRTCLLLRLSGLKYRQIQQRLNISLDEVKSRLHEARNQLRALLAEGAAGIEWPQDSEDDEPET